MALLKAKRSPSSPYPLCKSNAPQIEDWGCRQGWRRASEQQDVCETLSCYEEPPQKHALGEVDLTKSKTKGAAMQSIAVEEADYRNVVGERNFLN